MLTLAQQYWPFLLVALIVIIAVVFLLTRRGQTVTLDTDQPIRPTLAREIKPEAVAAPPVQPAFKIEPAAETPDPLTQIKGLGPRIASMLNAHGITRFEQLAALTPDEQVQLDQNLGAFKGRLEQDRWVDQARILAAGDLESFEREFGRINGG